MKPKLKMLICAIIVGYCFYSLNNQYSKYKNILIFIIIAASIYLGVCYVRRERQTMEAAPSGAPSLPRRPNQVPNQGLPQTRPQNLPEEFRFEQQRIPSPSFEEQGRFTER